jgi:hypothetical protein
MPPFREALASTLPIDRLSIKKVKAIASTFLRELLAY